MEGGVAVFSFRNQDAAFVKLLDQHDTYVPTVPPSARRIHPNNLNSANPLKEFGYSHGRTIRGLASLPQRRNGTCLFSTGNRLLSCHYRYIGGDLAACPAHHRLDAAH